MTIFFLQILQNSHRQQKNAKVDWWFCSQLLLVISENNYNSIIFAIFFLFERKKQKIAFFLHRHNSFLLTPWQQTNKKSVRYIQSLDKLCQITTKCTKIKLGNKTITHFRSNFDKSLSHFNYQSIPNEQSSENDCIF